MTHITKNEETVQKVVIVSIILAICATAYYFVI